MRFSANVPLGGDHFTPEALASLIGQTPALTRVAGDWKSALGKGTVVAAEEADGFLRLTIEADATNARRVEALIGIAYAETHGVGFTIADAEVIGPELPHRRVFKDVRLMEVGPQPPAPEEAP